MVSLEMAHPIDENRVRLLPLMKILLGKSLMKIGLDSFESRIHNLSNDTEII